MNTLGKCLLCLCTLANILVICSGDNVQSRLHTTPRTPSQSGGICQRLGNPANGKYTDLYNTSAEQQLLPLNSVLWYVCDEGYQIFPKNTLLICLRDGSWSQDPPICRKKCPALHYTDTTKVQCFDKSKTEIKCDEAVDEAVAQFECATTYVLADSHIPFSICWSGSWNPPPPHCIQSVDTCTSNGTVGICKIFNECASVRDDIAKGIFPVICGFQGNKSVVCCTNPGDPSATKTPVTTTSSVKVGARAAEMCKQYAEYAYEISEHSSLSLSPTVSKTLKCDIEKKALNVGRYIAFRQEFPHMAQVGYIRESETKWACAGSLISKNFILTAAQCVRNPNLGSPTLVRIGITNVADTKYLQVRNVQQIIKHPDFINKYNDIALLKMDSNFDMNPYVRPACIYTEKTIPYEHAIESAWGRISFVGEESENLLKVVLDFLSTAQCNFTFRRYINTPNSTLANGIVEDLMICAGSSKQFTGTCQGAGGAPLQVYHENTDDIKCMYDIVGITSFGQICGLAKTVTGVYTRVSAYVKWIEDNVWPR